MQLSPLSWVVDGVEGDLLSFERDRERERVSQFRHLLTTAIKRTLLIAGCYSGFKKPRGINLRTDIIYMYCHVTTKSLSETHYPTLKACALYVAKPHSFNEANFTLTDKGQRKLTRPTRIAETPKQPLYGLCILIASFQSYKLALQKRNLKTKQLLVQLIESLMSSPDTPFGRLECQN